ncbi:MAG: DUF1080 domain-containing protein [Planctomycetaceae bacterium]
MTRSNSRPVFGMLVLSFGIQLGCALDSRAADAPADEAGFAPLFDGKSLDGWDGDPRFWRVEEGAIVGQSTRENPVPHNTFLVWRKEQPADFELRFQYRITGGNSGVQYRSFELDSGKWRVGGYQADIDAANSYTGIVYGEQFRGILAPRGKRAVVGDDHKSKVTGDVGQADDYKELFRKDDWNDYAVVVRGHHHVLKINGVTTAELTDDDEQMRREDGLIALQLHAGPPMKVEFRNLRIRKVDR